MSSSLRDDYLDIWNILLGQLNSCLLTSVTVSKGTGTDKRLNEATLLGLSHEQIHEGLALVGDLVVEDCVLESLLELTHNG